MTAKTVFPRVAAERDTDEIVDHYRAEAGNDLARSFVDALQEAYRLIGENPGIGPERYASMLGIPGLRHWRMKRFPYLIFYLEQSDRVEIARILHVRRYIASTMPGMEE